MPIPLKEKRRRRKFYFAFKHIGGSTWQQLVTVGEACLNYISQGSCEATSVNDTRVYTQSATLLAEGKHGGGREKREGGFGGRI